ncbi:MAG: beta-ketoacyl-[acyl-carrier-protein] synthase family protein [Phycisphaerae bacterium]|jgi:3-oxoacyl-[acyl-carrier-protein] synthase II
MADRRVVITGLGVVCSAGVGAEPFWQAMLEGRQCVKGIDLFDAARFPCRIGGQLDDFSARSFVPKDYRKAVKVMARDIEIAVAAADLAFRDAHLETRGTNTDGKSDVTPARLGCNIGAGLICSDLDELGAAVNTAVTDGKFDLRKWGNSGMNNLTPLWLLKYLPNMLSCHVTIIHGAEGPSNTITCGDASGQLTVGEARRLILRGAADVVITGGAESKLNPMGLLRQNMLGRLATAGNEAPASACRPFDASACGTVIGEGGGLVILEELEHAKARGAKIYAEVVGFGASCDPAGIDVLTPTVGGLDLAVTKALADAEIKPDAIDLIVAHGTAVAAEDRLEVQAWRKAMGPAADKAMATALTGATGSLFAGAGAVELALAALAVKTGQVPPTVNFTQAAADCRLNLASKSRTGDIRHAVTGAFGIGGQSGAVVLKRYES